ncbi:MAG TPA: aminotransferase class I/II-fold pyridoxal phosphate-dependent enzyme [Candidatus Dormibacteraeota bacterium]|nr:aminotransferase class I/II-fold pyridoxal phosphate-dependent enzyme [Candidatus Dormibacteraeota bacterium]
MAQSLPKSKTTDLALLGGKATFAEPLHVGRPSVGDRNRFLERVNDMWDRRWFSNNGPYVREFEDKLRSFLGVKHCIPVCNGTIAMELAIRALELKGEVLVPSFTFISAAHALQWQEITPVFCDIDPRTHNLDPARVEQMITPRTTAIVGVHTWGRPCEVEALTRIARRNDLRLVFDAAHAFGCSHEGRMIGNFGDAEVYSFHATKFFNTFEGGAVATNDDQLASKIRLMKNFGFQGFDNVIYIGTNGKMTEICAAMGLTGLESLDEIIDRNRRNHQLYRDLLANCPGLTMVSYNDKERCNFQYVVFEIDEAAAGLSRDELIQLLTAENVLARRYFYPGCHRMQPYRSYFPHAGLLLPETERVAARVMSLPNGTSVGPAEIQTVCGLIRFAVENSDEIRAAVLRRESVVK